MANAFHIAVREVAGCRLIELDAEAVAPERVGRIGVSDDRAEAGHEPNLHQDLIVTICRSSGAC